MSSLDPALVVRARSLVAPGRRTLLGVTGSPGVGKSTLAIALADALNVGQGRTFAAVVGMDGYHLANRTLDRLGRRGRKGAIDTFDGWGFVGMLRRVAAEVDHDVYVPSFRREVDEPIAGEVTVPAGIPFVIVEGNYLLADEPPWDQIRPLLAECWYCEAPDEERIERLVVRHETHGRTLSAARDYAETVDQTNAVRIEASRSRADLIVHTASRLG